MPKQTKKTKKKLRKVTPSGKVYITAGFNNTIITITDNDGNTLFSGSAGKAGFKGSRKSTPFAAQMAAKSAATKAIDTADMKTVEVYVKGPGIGREAAIRSLFQSGLNITKIKDVTPVPHNGCRPKKRRRV